MYYKIDFNYVLGFNSQNNLSISQPSKLAAFSTVSLPNLNFSIVSLYPSNRSFSISIPSSLLGTFSMKLYWANNNSISCSLLLEIITLSIGKTSIRTKYITQLCIAFIPFSDTSFIAELRSSKLSS